MDLCKIEKLLSLLVSAIEGQATATNQLTLWLKLHMASATSKELEESTQRILLAIQNVVDPSVIEKLNKQLSEPTDALEKSVKDASNPT